MPHVKTGKLNLIAVTEDKRAALLPEIPTVAETLLGFEMVVWYGVFGPKNLPADITTKLIKELNISAEQMMLYVQDLYHGVDQIAMTLLNRQLLTINIFHAEHMELERLYSSNPESYPPGGRKQKRGTAWDQHVLIEQKILVDPYRA